MDRNSTTKPEPDTLSPVRRNTRRNSLAPSISSTTSSSSRLNYLRASTGSCHDFCKYGKEQSFEQNPRNTLQRRITSRPADNQILMRSANSQDRKKKSPTLPPKSASGSVSPSFDGSPGVRKEKASKPDSRKSPKSSFAASSVLSNPRKPSKDNTPVIKPLSKKVVPQRLSKSSNLPVKSISGPTRLSSSVYRLSLNPQRANKEWEGSGRGVSLSADVHKNVSGGKRAETKNFLPRIAVEKQKPNKVDAKTEPIERPVTELSVAERNESGFDICVSPETPVSVSTSLCFSNSPALSFQEEHQMEHEIGFRLSSKLDCPVLSSQEEYEVQSDSEGYYSDSDYEENPSMKLEEEISEARTQANHPEGVESKPMKLQFRRGKIVDLQSKGDTPPRRLKFRRGRTLEESRDVSDSTNKKCSNNREAESGAGDSADPSEKVVLRHNDIQERKDRQASLLNNVIEETASKLVESRKSKVKALVGAFETVISLHDTKPSARS